MKYTITKPTITVDDGFYADARAHGTGAACYMADLSPAAPELVDSVTQRFFKRNPQLENGKSLSADGIAQVEQWARGRAALANLISWQEQQANTRVFTIYDFYHGTSELTSLFPAWIESEIQATLISSGLIPWLTFGTTAVDSTKITCLYDSTPSYERELRKVGQGAELPRVKFTLADSTISAYKYGRSIEAAYEAIEAQTVDVIAHHIARIAQQVAVDETDAALDVLVGGDGTTAGAAESNSTDTDVATAGTVLYSDMLTWYLAVTQPYQLDKAVFGATDAAQIMNLAEFKDTTMNGALSNIPGPKNIDYRLWAGGVTGSSYVDRLVVGIDSRHALGRYTHGAFLHEQDKIIRRQVNEWTFSYYVAFRKFDGSAIQVLDCNSAL